MSSTARGKERNESDYYPTPPWCVHRLLEKCKLPGGRWLEPCAGHGDIIAACQSSESKILPASIDWTANELRTDTEAKLAKFVKRVRIGDFLEYRPRKRFNVSMSNPPFFLAMEVIEHSLSMADYVVMLLRLNYVGSDTRNEFFQTMMPDAYVLPERPSFDGKGTDSIEYAWFVWGPDNVRRRAVGQMSVLDSTPLEVRKAQKPLDLMLPEHEIIQTSMF